MGEVIESDGDIIIDANRDGGIDGVLRLRKSHQDYIVVDEAGDIVFRTSNAERARIKADGTGSGWPGVLGGISSYRSQTWSPLIERLRVAARDAQGKNSLELPVMTSPPTITTSAVSAATLDATLTKAWFVASGGVALPTAACFKYRGGTPVVNANVYYRFPVITLGSGVGNATATQNANGWAVEFYADTAKVMLVMLLSGSTRNIQIEVDNQLVNASPTAMPAASGTGYFLLDFTAAGGQKIRKFRVEGDQATGWRGVQTLPTGTVWAADPDREIVVAQIGDSIPSQTGATNPNGGYDISTAKILGWTNIHQIAVGGSGFSTGGASATAFGSALRVADAVAVNPDVLIIGASTNDVTSGAALRASMLAALQAYRTALPTTMIIVTGIWPGASGPDALKLAIEADMLTAFNTWADSNSYYIPYANDPQGSWIYGTGHVGATNSSGNSDFYVNSADTVHPSQAGHDFTARRFASAFRKNVLGVLG